MPSGPMLATLASRSLSSRPSPTPRRPRAPAFRSLTQVLGRYPSARRTRRSWASRSGVASKPG
jgi:hypothetical protein